VHRRVLDLGNTARLDAPSAMFTRYGYARLEAETRVLCYMRIGHNDADLHEPLEARTRQVPMYLKVFTGVEPT